MVGWCFLVCYIILGAIYFYHAKIEDKTIYPNSESYYFGPFTDCANGGKSVITNYFISDSLLQLEFDINEGFIMPYVGLHITHKSKSFMDFLHLNQLILEIDGQGVGNIGVYLFTQNYMLDKYPNLHELCFFLFFEYFGKAAKIFH